MVALGFANYLETGKFEEGGLLQDAILIRPDEKGTLGIDAIRTLKNFLWQKPVFSSRRAAIIDEAELLTTEAQNALLKIAEEPPPSTLLILVTSDIEALAPTLRSRLSRIYFSIVSKGSILELLQKMGLPKKTADDIAERSFGKPGLASRLVNDDALKARLQSASTLCKVSGDKRRAFIKGLLDDEEFDFNAFLDAMILNIVPEAKQNPQFWHQLLELRGKEASFNLNPRLQLDNLTRDL